MSVTSTMTESLRMVRNQESFLLLFFKKEDSSCRFHLPALVPPQFLVLSTNLDFTSQGIIPRNFSPTCSIGCSALRRRVALKLG